MLDLCAQKAFSVSASIAMGESDIVEIKRSGHVHLALCEISQIRTDRSHLARCSTS